jgi:hypothetical protein
MQIFVVRLEGGALRDNTPGVARWAVTVNQIIVVGAMSPGDNGTIDCRHWNERGAMVRRDSRHHSPREFRCRAPEE